MYDRQRGTRRSPTSVRSRWRDGTREGLANGLEVHRIRDVEMRVYSVVKTIADAFRSPKLVDRSVAIEAMKSTLSDRKATPGQLAAAARENRGWNQMRPYLEALTSNG